MKMILISDLHIGEILDKTRIDFINEILDEMSCAIDPKIPKNLNNEKMIVAVLGDLVDRGATEEKFKNVQKVLNEIRNRFSNIDFIFIPGNHELDQKNGSLDLFNKFCDENSRLKHDFSENDGVCKVIEIEGFSFFLLNSNMDKNHKSSGVIDIESLTSKIKSKDRNIIFLHHVPSEKAEAKNFIKNSTKLMNVNSNFIFYGHMHGYTKVEDYKENNSNIHSVGSFLVQDEEVTPEFILLDIIENKINFAYRYKKTQKDFTPNIIYPKKQNIQPEDSPSNYFKHPEKKDNIMGLKYVAENKFKLDMSDMILSNKKLVLLVGAAGSGKTTMIEHMFHKLYEYQNFYPLFIKLRNTTIDSVRDRLIYFKDKLINNKVPFFLLDGFDEIDSQYANELIKLINENVKSNPEVKAIITSRSNSNIQGFYEKPYTLANLEIDQIKVFLENLEIDQIKVFLENKNINADSFFHCVKESKNEQFLYIPFYLMLMIESYKKTGEIPKTYDLINMTISLRLQENRKNHEYEDSLCAYEYEISLSLQKLAFIMQTTNNIVIDNFTFTKYFTLKMRTYFINSNLVITNNNGALGYEFEHNIFREYLVALKIADLELEELLSIIACGTKPYIRQSYLKIIEIIIGLRKEQDLLCWVIENEPKYLHLIDNDKVSVKQKYYVFKKLLLSKDFVYFLIDNHEKFIKYYTSHDMIGFCYDLLTKEVEYSTFLYVIDILGFTDEFYEYDEKYIEKLVEIIKHPKYNDKHDDIIERSFRVIYSILKCNDFEHNLTKLILNDIELSNYNSYSYYILKILFESGFFDYDNFFHIIESNIFKVNDIRVMKICRLDSRVIVENIINNLSNKKTFLLILKKSIQSNYRPYHNEMIETCINNLESWNIDDYLENIDDFVDVYIILITTFNYTNQVIGIKDILVDKDKENLVFKKVLEKMNEKQLVNTFNVFINTEYTNLFDAKYKEHFENNKKKQSRYGSYSDIERKTKQNLFNILFANNKIDKMFTKLINKFPSGLDFDVIYEWDSSDVFKEFSLSVYHWSKNEDNFNDWKDKYDEFIEYQLIAMLRNYNYLKVDDHQKVALEFIFNDMVDYIVENDLCQVDFWCIEDIIFLIKKFEFTINADCLIKIFKITTNQLNIEDGIFYDLLSKNQIYDKALKEEMFNIDSIDDSQDNFKENYFSFYYKLDKPDAIQVATSILKSKQNNYFSIQSQVLEYLIKFKGEMFVDSLVSKCANEYLLKKSSVLLKTHNENLISVLEYQNRNAEPNSLLHLDILIKLGVTTGFDNLINLVRNNSTITSTHISTEIRLQISNIYNKEFLYLLVELFKEVIVTKFTDDSISLEGAVITAIRNIAKNNIYEVSGVLEDLKMNNKVDFKDRLCPITWLIEKVEVEKHNLFDKPLELIESINKYEKIFDN